jgi:hypothetical protein
MVKKEKNIIFLIKKKYLIHFFSTKKNIISYFPAIPKFLGLQSTFFYSPLD